MTHALYYGVYGQEESAGAHLREILFKTAPVFTLEPACGHSQLREPTQFIRVVQVGLSPP